MTAAAELFLLVSSDRGDTEELDRWMRELLTEVRQSGVQSAELVRDEAPPGTKSGGIEALGMIALQLAPAVIPHVIGLLQDWSQRARGRSVKLKAKTATGELELEFPVGSMTQAEVKKLLEAVTGAPHHTGGP